MKKCPGCQRDIDKHSIACQYCGKLTVEHDHDKTENNDQESDPQE